MRNEIKRMKVLDLWVDPVDMAMARERVADFVELGSRSHSVFAVNPEKCFSVPRDRELHSSFRQADLLIPDGIGVVLAARLLYGAKLRRVPGVELMEEICCLAAERGYGVFLFGAREEVSAKAAQELINRYPGLRVVGRRNGYVAGDEIDGLVDEINASGAQVLFLALGSPRQEKWLSTYGDRLATVRVCQGIGGTLDTIAGTVKRAPQVWCRFGAEWLYRLLKEPSRLKRQRILPVFVLRVLASKLKQLFVTGGGSGNMPAAGYQRQ
jgi:N-acetylglucosaminyldiphosphoundecaprenol N-acetyl-beta-D-mannosaminyltransferase